MLIKNKQQAKLLKPRIITESNENKVLSTSNRASKSKRTKSD